MDKTLTLDELNKRLEDLDFQIGYKESHIETCELYPTDTVQFHMALQNDKDNLQSLKRQREVTLRAIEDITKALRERGLL